MARRCSLMHHWLSLHCNVGTRYLLLDWSHFDPRFNGICKLWGFYFAYQSQPSTTFIFPAAIFLAHNCLKLNVLQTIVSRLLNWILPGPSNNCDCTMHLPPRILEWKEGFFKSRRRNLLFGTQFTGALNGTVRRLWRDIPILVGRACDFWYK